MANKYQLDKLLKKKGWTGKEVGQLLIASMLNDIKQQGQGEKTPLFSQSDFEKMESSLNSDFDYQRINNTDLVIPIPSHFTSLVKRGFSPSAEFANQISKLTNVKLCALALKQKYGVKKQAKLKRESRIKNVKGSFYVRKHLIQEKSILLIDDIITTGATMKEAESTLLAHGARSVDFLSMAVSPLILQS